MQGLDEVLFHVLLNSVRLFNKIMFVLLHFISYNRTVLVATVSPFTRGAEQSLPNFPREFRNPCCPTMSHHTPRFSTPNFQCACCHVFLHSLLTHLQSVALPFQIWKSVSNASIQFYFHSKHSSPNHHQLLNSIFQWVCNVSAYFHFFSSTIYSLDGKESNRFKKMGG